MKRNPFKCTERQAAADGWGSFCFFFADPLAAWESVFSPERVTVTDPLLGGISALVQPFVYLQERGTSESLGKELETLREAATILRRLSPGGLHEPNCNEKTACRIEGEIPRMERMRRAAELAEGLLGRNGFKYNARTGKTTIVAKRKGADLLVRIIQRLGIEYGNNPEGREKIRGLLSPIFEAEIDSGPRGNIAKALQNMKRKGTAAPSKR